MNQTFSLDDPASYAQLDPEDMYARINDLPDQVREAWQLAGQLSLPQDFQQVRSVVIAGMGGSAIGGSLLQSYGADRIPVPLEVWRGYGLPAYVNRDTLLIVVSYSGGTEETLSALQQGHERGAKLLVISTGGQAARWAQEWQVPLLTFSYQAQPRATLGYLFTPLVRIFARLGFLDSQERAYEESLQVLDQARARWAGPVPERENLAKQFARRLHGHAVVVYGAEYLAAVARRWKTQLNENAKNWAFYEEFPELNHNAIVGYEFPRQLARVVQVMMLRGDDLSDRVRVRMQVTQELLERFDIPFELAPGQGATRLAQIFSLIALGDYVSYYLALLNGANPTTITPINILKERLAQVR